MPSKVAGLDAFTDADVMIGPEDLYGGTLLVVIHALAALSTLLCHVYAILCLEYMIYRHYWWICRPG